MDCNELWATVMSSQSYPRAMCKNTTGFHGGQNIVAWVNSSAGGLYGQNIGTNGEMGEIEPTALPDIEYEEIETVTAVYNINGQVVNCVDVNKLPQGIYIIEGITVSGKKAIHKLIK